MKAIRELGWARTVKFGLGLIAHVGYDLLLIPPLRTMALRLMGARVGVHTVLCRARFLNLHRTGFRGLRIGDSCFIGDDCLIDLANAVTLEDHVTLAARVTVLTHMNVGYADHPLQVFLPSMSAPVVLRCGSFVGANATLLPGIEVGSCAVVAAGAVVRTSVPPFAVVGGVPAKILRWLQDTPSAANASSAASTSTVGIKGH
jgi:acetyltransferase-like isoleucine patch superfamily enzyme